MNYRNQVFLITVATSLGWFANVMFNELKTWKSYNNLLANQYSDYLLPLTTQYREAIKDDNNFSEFKNDHPDIRYFDINYNGKRLVVASIRSVDSPYHVGIISNEAMKAKFQNILTNEEFIELLFRNTN